METYRLTASALLRLASLAAKASDEAYASEILGIVQAAQAEPASLPHVEDGPDAAGDADKPAKPE